MMSASDSKALDQLLGNLFFGCNIPFNIVESDHFKRFVNKLNPLYKLPGRRVLSEKILDERYEQFEKSIQSIESKNAVLLIDGWKNSSANTKNVVGMLHLKHGEHLFLDSWDFSRSRETGEALTEVVNHFVQMSRDKYNINVYAVTTDNASNMMYMGRFVNLWHTTCNSHSGNLLCKSLTDTSFAAKVNALLKEFKSPSLEKEIISRGGNRMVLAGDTRWCTYRDTFRRCLKNLPFMKQIAQAPQYNIKPANYDLLFNDEFEGQLVDSILILDPVCTLINACQSIDCNLAKATELWLNLTIPTDNEQHHQLLKDRLKKVISPCGLAANFLNPKYKGLSFCNNDSYVNMMNNFFRTVLTEDGLKQLDDYKNGEGIFGNLLQKNSSSKAFWSLSKCFYPELSTLADNLDNIPASTGELERLFSQWSYVHSSKRNRLTSQRSAKLVALYYTLKFKDLILYEDDDND